MERIVVMKKINLTYKVEKSHLFGENFRKILCLFTKNVSHLEIRLNLVELDEHDVGIIIKMVKKICNKNDFEDTILTFVFCLKPSHKLAEIMKKIRFSLTKIELLYNENDSCILRENLRQMQESKLPCNILLKEENITNSFSKYNDLKPLGVNIFVEEECEYDSLFFELLNKWIYDVDGVRFSLFAEVISQIIIDYWGSKCKFKSCLTNFFTLNDHGTIYGCKSEENELCNISDISDIQQLYSTDHFGQLLHQAIEKRNTCKNECRFFDLCLGGCPNVNETIKNCNNIMLFEKWDDLISKIYELINNVDYGQINPAVREIILSGVASNKIFEKELI